jgi:hypothetical protein
MVPNDRRFFGKVATFGNGICEVEFFQSVALRERVKLPSAAVSHTILPNENWHYFGRLRQWMRVTGLNEAASAAVEDWSR